MMNAKAKIEELVTEFNSLVDEITERQQRQMEIKGYISRRHLGKNKRKRHVFLTKKGRKLNGKYK